MSPTKTRTSSAKATSDKADKSAPSKAAAGKAVPGNVAAGKSPAGKSAASKSPAGKAGASNAPVAKSAVAKSAVGKAPVGKSAVGKAPVGKVATAVTPAKKAAKVAAAPSSNGKVPAAAHSRAATAGSPSPGAQPGPYAGDGKFLAEQQTLLVSERLVYEAQASDLKAEADSLAQEREPGDVQFDEESGEGGTVTVDRERDLALSAQATAAVEEIDAAMARIADRSYGGCERCHQAIPKPRLKALPYARLCVACKSGGLSRR